MIRTVARKAILLAAATLCVGALAVNCSHKDTGSQSEVGSVGLAITLPGGGIVSTVHYSVHNAANVEVTQGNINVADAMASVSIVIGGLPAGGGYTVVLSAMANDGTSCLGTSAAFTVVANMSVSVNVLLLCRTTGNTGTVIVNGQIDICPIVTSYVVSPLAVSAGGAIDVSSAGSDFDASDVVTFHWSAGAGTFDNANAAGTRYHCPAASSQQTLTITVSDNIIPGSTPATPKCSTSAMIVVNCGLCGNGTVEAAAGEQCDPPNGTTCDSTCRTIAVVCGNGIVQAGEQCDPPNGTTCSLTCQTITGTGGAPGTGGAGTGGAGTAARAARAPAARARAARAQAARARAARARAARAQAAVARAARELAAAPSRRAARLAKRLSAPRRASDAAR